MRAPLVGIVGWPQQTNVELAAAWRALGIDAALLTPPEAPQHLGPGDVAIGRIDVRQALDGVEPGLSALRVAGRAGTRVLNRPEALLNAHDKLATARLLAEAGVPHPPTLFVPPLATEAKLPPPLVLKPRFGSWGRDVYRCETAASVAAALRAVRDRQWFRAQGAVAQALVAPRGYDLRLIVASGRVAGAVERVAAPGEWRTNVALGGTRRPATLTEEATELGLAAVAAIGADFVGVDLLPLDGGFIVVELNGAVEFDRTYDVDGADVYEESATALDLPRVNAEVGR